MPKANEQPVAAIAANGFDAMNIKIKQEKISPPPSPSASAERRDTTEDLLDKFLGETKPVAEPVKSSNEILADLFKVFNAAPPKLKETEDGEDDGAEGLSSSATAVHKHKKKHKKEKKSKKSKQKKRGRSSSDGSGGSSVELDSNEKQKESSKSHKAKKEKKRAKRKADDGIENDSKHKRRKKSKDREKSRTRDTKSIVKKEKLTDDDCDVEKTTDREMRRKSKETSAEATKQSTKSDALDRLNDKIKERKKSNEKHKDSATESKVKTSTTSEGDSAGGRKKIVIKSLVNSTVYRDTLKEVDAKQKEKEKEREKEKEKTRAKERKSNGEKTRERRERSRDHRSGSSSLSLSDEETYLKERESRYNSSGNKYADRDRDRDDFYGDSRRRERTRDRDLRDRSDRYEYKERGFRSSHFRYEHDRRRSRSRERNSEDRIDKKRLLEIARKNAITMLKNGTLPGTQNLAAEAKEKALAKMRYGGKTVDELTEFCKRLSKGESSGYLSNVTDDSEDEADIDKPFNHPFILKDRGPIVMNIKNSIPIPPKTSEQTKAILMQFPVSSGQHHRLNESEWVPVVPAKPPKKDKEPQQQPLAIMPAPSAVPDVSQPIAPQPVPPVKSVQPVPPVLDAEAIPAASIPLPQPMAAPTPTPTITSETYLQQQHQQQTYQYPPPVDEPISSSSIFPESSGGKELDVTSIITKRLNAMRKLQDNPLDTEALKLMYNTQKDMSAWASSKFVPGQFTGSTGANVLTAKELSSGFQAWAKRDQLISTTPVSGGMGMHLLQKMGWRPGEGLGKEKNGSLQPLLLEVKLDKRGLVANEETPQNQRQKTQQSKKKATSIQMAKQNMESKHPVSLLGELCAKRKYGPPFYEVVMEDGPFHLRKFLFKVTMNGQAYQPTIPSLNKKEAKAVAARYALEQMGLFSGPPTIQ